MKGATFSTSISLYRENISTLQVKMETSQILATGGASGGVVAALYVAYLLCKSRRSRCTSNCTTDSSDAPSTPQQTKPHVEVAVAPEPQHEPRNGADSKRDPTH